MSAKILKLETTYVAKLVQVWANGLLIKTAGTLDGFLDLSITDIQSSNRTYNISCAEARMIATALLKVVDDIEKNCLYDRDKLLAKK